MDRKELDKLFNDIRPFRLALKPRSAKSHIPEDWPSPYSGDGFDVEEISQYVPGDDPRKISIEASAKARQLMVVKRTELKEDRILIVLDLSPSMFLRDKLRIAYSAVMMVSMNALRQHIPCGIFIADRHQTAEFMPRLGDGQLYRLKEAIETSICNDISSAKGGATRSRFGNLALRMWNHSLPKGSCVFLISDFLGASDENLRSLLEERAYDYVVVPVVVQDELEYSFPTDLPRGSVSIEAMSVETQDVISISINRSQAQRIKQEHEDRFSALKETFSSNGLLWAHVSSPDPREICGILKRALHRITRR